MMDWQILENEDGSTTPVRLFMPKSDVRQLFILLPALGIRAAYYDKLAQGLRAFGVATVVVEQRGNGESPYRPSWRNDFTLSDYLRQDIKTVTDWCQTEFPDARIFVGGHSLGGHMASLAVGAHPEAYEGIVHLACGFPYHGDYPKRAATFVKLLAHIIPVLTTLLGYYPGHWFSFGRREYRGLMMDWRHWALKGRYAIPGFEEADEKIAGYSGQVISIAFEKDDLASDAAIERSRAALASAKMTRLKLGHAEQGDYLGHVAWAKEPAGVVRALGDWFKGLSG